MSKGRYRKLGVTQLVRLELGWVRGPTCVLRTSVPHYGSRLLERDLVGAQLREPGLWAERPAQKQPGPWGEAAGQPSDLLPGVAETALREQKTQRKQLGSFLPSSGNVRKPQAAHAAFLENFR